MGAELFASEILKGLTQGINQGMQMRRQKEQFDVTTGLKERELDIREKSMLSDKALREMDIGIKAGRAETDLMEAQLKDERAKKKLELDAAKAVWSAANDAEMTGLRKDKEESQRLVRETKTRLDIVQMKFDAIDNKMKSMREDAKFKEEKRTNKAREEEAVKKRELEQKKLNQGLIIAREKNASNERIKAMGASGGLTGKRGGILAKRLDKLQQNPRYKRTVEAMDMLPEIRAMLRDARAGNSVANENIGALVAKLKEQGRLTDEDVQRYWRPARVDRKIKDALSRWIKGRKSLETLDEIEGVVKASDAILQARKRRVENEYAKSTSRMFKIPLSTVRDAWVLSSGESKPGKKKKKYTAGQIITIRGKKRKVVIKNGIMGTVPVK